MFNIIYKTYIGPINLNVVIRNQIDSRRKKYYNYDKIGHFVKDCRQPKKLPWKLISQKNINIVNIEYSIVITERILFLIDFENVFISISLNISDIKLEENSDIDESEEFNADV